MSYTAGRYPRYLLLGHGGDGKTALAEACHPFLTKGTDRLVVRGVDGNTVSDFDSEDSAWVFHLHLDHSC